MERCGASTETALAEGSRGTGAPWGVRRKARGRGCVWLRSSMRPGFAGWHAMGRPQTCHRPQVLATGVLHTPGTRPLTRGTASRERERRARARACARTGGAHAARRPATALLPQAAAPRSNAGSFAAGNNGPPPPWRNLACPCCATARRARHLSHPIEVKCRGTPHVHGSRQRQQGRARCTCSLAGSMGAAPRGRQCRANTTPRPGSAATGAGSSWPSTRDDIFWKRGGASAARRPSMLPPVARPGAGKFPSVTPWANIGGPARAPRLPPRRFF